MQNKNLHPGGNAAKCEADLKYKRRIYHQPKWEKVVKRLENNPPPPDTPTILTAENPIWTLKSK